MDSHVRTWLYKQLKTNAEAIGKVQEDDDQEGLSIESLIDALEPPSKGKLTREALEQIILHLYQISEEDEAKTELNMDTMFSPIVVMIESSSEGLLNDEGVDHQAAVVLADNIVQMIKTELKKGFSHE